MDKLHALENFILSELMNAPTETDILDWNGKRFTINGKEATAAETQTLIASAQALKVNPFWQLLIKELKREGQSRIGAKSKSWDDVHFGKACLYIADLAERKSLNAAALKIPAAPPVEK